MTNYFAKKGIRAECIKLNGAIELAPKLGICSTIVDLVSTGKTIKENNLEETDVLFKITSKLIINKIAYKLMNDNIISILEKFKRILMVRLLLENEKGFSKKFEKLLEKRESVDAASIILSIIF